MPDKITADIETPSGAKIVVTGNVEDVKSIISHVEGIIPKKKAASDKSKKRQKPEITRVGVPIPFDIKGNDQKPSLRDFYETKNPSSNREKLAVYVYYLANHANIKEIKKGHVAFAYKATKQKRPNIDQLIIDTRNALGYVTYDKNRGNVSLTPIGEDFVEIDLPRKTSEIKKDKT